MAQQIAELTQTQTIADLVTPLDTVAADTTGKTLGSVLSKVTSSHSAVFIFDEQGEFAGLVSPYKTLYASNLPYTTKVEAASIMPPAITAETSLYDAVTHMLATKIYTLPVFNDAGKVTGVISGHDILKHVTGEPEMLRLISAAITVQKPVTASINASVGDIYNQLKEAGVSRIILTGDTGALAGIVTRNDLARAFTEPSVRRRYPSEGSVFGFHSRGGEKKFRADYPVRRYATTMVDTLPAGSSQADLVTHLTNSAYNSLVLIDGKLRPVGFLSIRDLLQAVSPPEEIPDASLIMTAPDSEDIPADQLAAGQKHLALFWGKLRKRMAIEKTTVTTTVRNNSVEQPRIFSATIKVTPVAGEPLIASSEARSYLDSLQAATALIEKQRKRSSLRAART